MMNDFDEFYALYPRKVSKGVARKTWNKLDHDVHAMVIEHLQIRVRSDAAWLTGERKYIPYPASWLNAEGWHDEYETVPVVLTWDEQQAARRRAMVEANGHIPGIDGLLKL